MTGYKLKSGNTSNKLVGFCFSYVRILTHYDCDFLCLKIIFDFQSNQKISKSSSQD